MGALAAHAQAGCTTAFRRLHGIQLATSGNISVIASATITRPFMFGLALDNGAARGFVFVGVIAVLVATFSIATQAVNPWTTG